MAKGDETPRTSPAEIESLIEQIQGTNLDPRAKDKIERLLRTVLTLVELLQRKNTSMTAAYNGVYDGPGIVSLTDYRLQSWREFSQCAAGVC